MMGLDLFCKYFEPDKFENPGSELLNSIQVRRYWFIVLQRC